MLVSGVCVYLDVLENVYVFFIIVMRDWACACVHNREFKNMCVFIRMRDGLVLAYTSVN